MQEQKFTYRGKDLIAPLKNLIALLALEEEKANEKLVGFDKSNMTKNIMGLDPASQVYFQLEAKHKNILFELKKAKNWLREAQRTKWTKWTLDFSDLEWLYREKI